MQRLEGLLHHGLGVRPRHQRRVRQCERKPPKLLHAKNARDRLAVDAAPCVVIELRCLRRRESPRLRCDQAGQIETEHGADQKPRVELGRIDSTGGEAGSERIRTYNFPQGRVTDHRINLTLYKLPQVISGEALGELIDALVTQHQADLLAAEGVQ